jgi:hypothetical protein
MIKCVDKKSLYIHFTHHCAIFHDRLRNVYACRSTEYSSYKEGAHLKHQKLEPNAYALYRKEADDDTHKPLVVYRPS